MTQSETIEVFGQSVEPGQVVHHRVQMAQFSDGAPMTMPLTVINGAKPGPTLYLQASVHGEEITGSEIVIRAAATVSPENLSGALIVAPMANIAAYLTRTRNFALEERLGLNMHGVFPGAETFLTDRLAKKIYDEILLKSDMAIDMHTAMAGANCAPFSYVLPTDNDDGLLEKREAMAIACSTSGLVYYLSEEDCRSFRSIENYEATFFEQAHLKGIPTILWEMGEGRRVTREYVQLGVDGIRNVMIQFDMLPGEVKTEKPITKFTKLACAFAEVGGLAHVTAKLETRVEKGQQIAEIIDPFGNTTPVLAPAAGTVLRVLTENAIFPGAEIAWIAY